MTIRNGETYNRAASLPDNNQTRGIEFTKESVMKLSIAFAGTNPRIEPLLKGEAAIHDVELDVHQFPNLYHENLHNDEMDISEMSISETLIALERREKFGAGKWNWSPIPIFMSRGHGWAGLCVAADSPIKDLSDLKGKRVGVPDYEMTQAVWMRNVLNDLYGISASDIIWYSLRKRGESHALELYLDVDQPPGIEVHWPTPEQDEYEMLLSGELDASPLPRDKVVDNPKVRRLMPDIGKQVITNYYRKTGLFEPNHHYFVQNRLVAEHPWLPRALFDALKKSKEISYQHNAKEAKSDEATGLGPEVFGDDPYPLGMKGMRPTLDRLMTGMVEQGLLTKPMKLEDVYHPSTLDT